MVLSKETKNVLFLIDMQNDFITGSLANSEAEKEMPAIIDLIKDTDWSEFIITKDTHKDDYMQSREGGDLPVPHCFKDTEGWDLYPGVLEAVKESCDKKGSSLEIFDKPTFGSLELGNTLRKKFGDGKGVTFYFAGFCTDICVISNVCIARAACPEAVITVLKDYVAGVTPESNETALKAMAGFQTKIV